MVHIYHELSRNIHIDNEDPNIFQSDSYRRTPIVGLLSSGSVAV